MRKYALEYERKSAQRLTHFLIIRHMRAFWNRIAVRRIAGRHAGEGIVEPEFPPLIARDIGQMIRGATLKDAHFDEASWRRRACLLAQDVDFLGVQKGEWRLIGTFVSGG